MITQTPSVEQEPLNIEEFLSVYDAYIQQCVRRQFRCDRIPVEVLDLEIDDLVQQTRVRLWNALQRRTISHIQSYIRRMVQHLIANMACPKSIIPLPIDEEENNYSEINFIDSSWDDLEMFSQNTTYQWSTQQEVLPCKQVLNFLSANITRSNGFTTSISLYILRGFIKLSSIALVYLLLMKRPTGIKQKLLSIVKDVDKGMNVQLPCHTTH